MEGAESIPEHYIMKYPGYISDVHIPKRGRNHVDSHETRVLATYACTT